MPHKEQRVGLYISGDLRLALEKRQSETGATFSGMVDALLRGALGLPPRPSRRVIAARQARTDASVELAQAQARIDKAVEHIPDPF